MYHLLRKLGQALHEASDLRAALQWAVPALAQSLDVACSLYVSSTNTYPCIAQSTALDFKSHLARCFQSAAPLEITDGALHYRSVPIRYRQKNLGILVIEHGARTLSAEQRAILESFATQLSGILAQAKSAGTFRALYTHDAPCTIKGIPAAPGVALGVAVCLYNTTDFAAVPDRESIDPAAELNDFHAALRKVRTALLDSRAVFESVLPEAQQLFDVYLQLLSHSRLLGEIEQAIAEGNWAPGAVRQTLEKYVRTFEGMEDPYLRERAHDIRDLGRRLLDNLQGTVEEILHYPEATILVGHDLSPTAIAAVPPGKLVGVISLQGSENSHVAILAHALGIPAVMDAQAFPLNESAGKPLLIDGDSGDIYIAPSAALQQGYSRIAEEIAEKNRALYPLQDLPATTRDGHCIDLRLNMSMGANVEFARQTGAEGVGLYRSESYFMGEDFFPSESAQSAVYQRLLTDFAPQSVVVRTLDIGGDKSLAYFRLEEKNPALGWRGLRVSLDHPDMLASQLRALCSANAGLGNLHIMFPMVSHISELDTALEILDRVCQDLKIVRPPVGMMLEVPAVLYQIPAYAKRVDFFSVGSNDLVQYLLAADRQNRQVRHLYDPLHPSVIQALSGAVLAAKAAGRPISLCGRMASDPPATVLLVAMGFDSLSLNPAMVGPVKALIRAMDYNHAQALLSRAAAQESAAQVRGLLAHYLQEIGMGSLGRSNLA